MTVKRSTELSQARGTIENVGRVMWHGAVSGGKTCNTFTRDQLQNQRTSGIQHGKVYFPRIIRKTNSTGYAAVLA